MIRKLFSGLRGIAKKAAGYAGRWLLTLVISAVVRQLTGAKKTKNPQYTKRKQRKHVKNQAD